MRDGMNGFLVEPKSVNQLQIALLQLLVDKERALALGLAGKQIAKKEFSIEAMVEGNYQVYQMVL